MKQSLAKRRMCALTEPGDVKGGRHGARLVEAETPHVAILRGAHQRLHWLDIQDHLVSFLSLRPLIHLWTT